MTGYVAKAQGLRGFNLCLVLIAAWLVAGPAAARTATFVSPASLSAGEISFLSTAGDNAGAFLGLGQTLALVFDQPFGLTAGADTISIFTLAPPPPGRVRFSVSFGVYNNGAPTIVRSRNLNAGGSITVSNLFQRGCGVLAGCDYIEITTTRARRGATGAEIDYVDVNGEVTAVSAPTPEPATWALMIIGFAAIAARLKQTRRPRVRASQPFLRSSVSSG